MELNSIPGELRPFIEEKLAAGRSLDEIVCVERRLRAIPARNDIRDIVFEIDDRFGRAVAARVYDSASMKPSAASPTTRKRVGRARSAGSSAAASSRTAHR